MPDQAPDGGCRHARSRNVRARQGHHHAGNHEPNALGVGKLVPKDDAETLMHACAKSRANQPPGAYAIGEFPPVPRHRLDRHTSRVLVDAPGKSELQSDEDEECGIHHQVQDRRISLRGPVLARGSAAQVQRCCNRVDNDAGGEDGNAQPDPVTALQDAERARQHPERGIKVDKMP